jgi:hypothetical protein
MEIVIGVVVVFFLLIFIGKLKGAPVPESMTERAIFQRLQTEGAWISKYLSQPYSTQQSESLKRMYDEKTAYIQSLKAELTKRQMAQGSNAIWQEMAPILQRASELVQQGSPETEAHATALKEWHSKNT